MVPTTSRFWWPSRRILVVVHLSVVTADEAEYKGFKF